MIRILPCFKPGFKETKGYYRNCNTYFYNSRNCQFAATYPAGFMPSVIGDDKTIVVRKGFKDYYLYDFAADVVSDKPLTKYEFNSRKKTGFSYYIDQREDGLFELMDVDNARSLPIDEELGHIAIEMQDSLILKKGDRIACVSKKDASTIWVVRQGGQLRSKYVDEALLFCIKNRENWTTTLVFRDIETGRVDKEVILGYCGNIAKTSDERITLIGWRRQGGQSSTAFVHYYLKAGEVKEVPIKGDPSYLNIYDDDIAVYCRKENQVDVWKNGGKGKSYIGAINIDTGERISQIELPNICFPQSPGFAIQDGAYFAAGIARTPWPASY